MSRALPARSEALGPGDRLATPPPSSSANLRRCRRASGRRVLVAVTCVGAALAGSSGALGGESSSQEPPIATFSEALEVTTREVVVDLEGAQRPDPRALALAVGGREQTVESVRPLVAGEWNVLVYVDVPLSDHGTVLAASEALAGEAETLASLGNVRLVVADPAPVERVASTREALRLREELAAVGREMGPHEVVAMRAEFRRALAIDPEMAAAYAPLRAASEVELVRRQLERLLGVAAEGCAGPPCALLLVADGFDERPADFYLRSAARRPGGAAGAEDLQPPSERLSSHLAALGWTVLFLPLRERGANVHRADASDSDDQRWRESALRPGDGIRLPARPRIPPSAVSAIDDALELLLLPLGAPLRLAAEETGGAATRDPARLRPALEALAQRSLVSFQATWPATYGLLPLSLRARGASGDLRAPRWALAGDTPELVAARLRRLFDTPEEEPVAGLAMRWVERRGPELAVATLQVSLPPEAFAGSRPSSWELATLDEHGRLSLVAAGEPRRLEGNRWLLELQLPDDARHLGVLVRAGAEAFGATVGAPP